MIAQVPSERRVIVVPSGRVTLVVEKLSPFVDPVVTEEPALELPPTLVEVPPTDVDEDTLPESAVTDDEDPPRSVDFCSIIVQVDPSSSLISSA